MADEKMSDASADAEAPNGGEEAEDVTNPEPEAPVDAETAEPEAGEAETEEPVAEADAPASDAPASDAPASDEPVAEADEPASDAPASDAPASDESQADEPATDEATAPSGDSSSAKPKKKRLARPLRPQKTRVKRVPSSERKPISRLPKPEYARGRRQERQGKVVSAAMDKTIVVRVDVAKVHPRYKKVIKRSSKFHAHDEQNEAKVGDIVLIVETRPLSRTKRWRLQQIVEAAR